MFFFIGYILADWDIPGTTFMVLWMSRECILTSCELKIISSLALHWFKLSNRGVRVGWGWGIQNSTRANLTV